MAIYAKVENGVITEYPITETDYNLRFEEVDIVECFENKKPVIDPDAEYLVDEPYILAELSEGPLVIINYTKKKHTVDELLNTISTNNYASIAEIPSGLLNAAITAIKDKTQNTLDEFARTRDYSSIRSAITYKTSSVQQFSIEANRCEYLRDTTWNNLNNYLTDIMNGVKPLPLSWIDVEQNLPQLTW